MTKLSAHVAQTNLQLYRQLLDAQYPLHEIKQIHEAYMLTALRSAGQLRGSGKAFVAHLAGTASLCVLERAPCEVIIAAILHTFYRANHVSAADKDGMQLANDRADVSAKFGVEAEALTHAYFINGYLDDAGRAQLAADLSETASRYLQMLVLADNLEDALDLGLAVHGSSHDEAERRGSAAWRVQRMTNETESVIAQAEQLEFKELARVFRLLLVENQQALTTLGLFTGHYGSFRVG